MLDQKELISIGIPVFNEEEALPELFDRLSTIVSEMTKNEYIFEIIFVNDGSTDESPTLLDQAAEANPAIKVIHLSRNFGHQAGISCICEHAQGEALVILDADLQDPPELIPQFLEKYRSGYDVVFAIRARRQGPVLLRFCYLLYYRLLKLLSSDHIPLDSGDCGLISRKALNAINNSGDYHRFHRGLRAWVGFQQIGLPMNRPERLSGKSKYSFIKLLSLALDGIFSFSRIPLKLAFFLGLLIVVLCLLFAAYAVYERLTSGQSPTGFTALLLTIVFMSGAQLIFVGVLGEYIGRIFEQVKGRPRYLVDRIVNRNSK